MHEIELSRIPNVQEFHAAVKAHVDALNAHSKTEGKPRPVSHPMIEACVRRIHAHKGPDRFEADYKIIDDTPQPDVPSALSFEAKKVMLTQQIHAAEAAAKNAVLPERKVRWLSIRYNLVNAKRAKEMALDADENSVLQQFEDVQKRWVDIDMKAAEALHDVEDLTEENIDNWKVPDFG